MTSLRLTGRRADQASSPAKAAAAWLGLVGLVAAAGLGPSAAAQRDGAADPVSARTAARNLPARAVSEVLEQLQSTWARFETGDDVLPPEVTLLLTGGSSLSGQVVEVSNATVVLATEDTAKHVVAVSYVRLANVLAVRVSDVRPVQALLSFRRPDPYKVTPPTRPELRRALLVAGQGLSELLNGTVQVDAPELESASDEELVGLTLALRETIDALTRVARDKLDRDALTRQVQLVRFVTGAPGVTRVGAVLEVRGHFDQGSEGRLHGPALTDAFQRVL